MRFKTANMDVEVSRKKVKASLLAQQDNIKYDKKGAMVIIKRDLKTGLLVKGQRVVKSHHFMLGDEELVEKTVLTTQDGKDVTTDDKALEYLDRYETMLLDEHGNEVKKENVVYYCIQDGEEVEVSPYPVSTVLDVPEENWASASVLDDYIFESNVYEVFSDDETIQAQLFKEAELRLKADQVGVCAWSNGGFKQQYAFLVPFVLEGQFVWLMRFTDKQAKWSYMTDIPSETAIPRVRERAATISSLPGVAAIVASKKVKQKK